MNSPIYCYKKTYRTPRNLSSVEGFISENNWSVDFNRPLDYMETNDLGLSLIIFFTPSEGEN